MCVWWVCGSICSFANNSNRSFHTIPCVLKPAIESQPLVHTHDSLYIVSSNTLEASAAHPEHSLLQRVAHGSDSTPNLHLTDLTNGTYVFTMATANAAGQWAERRKVTLRVKENPLSRVLVQIVISVNAQTFTQADLVGLLLKVLL